MGFVKNIATKVENCCASLESSSKNARAAAGMISTALAQGTISSFELIFSFLMKDSYLFSPPKANLMDAFFQLPWAFQPIWYSLSDNFDIKGYRRKSYLIFSSLLAIVAYLILIYDLSNTTLGIISIILLGTTAALQNSVIKGFINQRAYCLGESDYHRQRINTTQTSSLYMHLTVAKFIMAISLMFIYNGDNASLFFTIGLLVEVTLLIIGRLLPDPKVGMNSLETSFTQIKSLNESLKDKEATINEENLIFSKINLKSALRQLRTRNGLRSLIFILSTSFIPHIGQVRFFFYTNGLEIGPSYMAFLKLVSYIGVFITYIIYNRWLNGAAFEKFYRATTFICIAFSLSQLILVTGINRIILSDHLYSIIDTLLIEITYQLIAFTPTILLHSAMNSKEVENTIHPILLATSFLANCFSMMLGGLLADVLEIEAFDYSRLPMLVIITSLMFLIPYFISTRLIDSSAIQEELISSKLDQDTSLGHGSFKSPPESPATGLDQHDYSEEVIPTQKPRFSQTSDEGHLQEHVNTFS